MASVNFVRSEFETLVYWIHERERVRAAKDAGKSKPWTLDPLLLDYRWCNVCRANDRVSRWLAVNWYPAVADFEWLYGRSLMPTAAVLARMINWPDTLAEILPSFGSFDNITAALHARKARGEKIFTGAYIVPSLGDDKASAVVEIARMVFLTYDTQPTMEFAWREMKSYAGIGTFLAGQIVADIAWLRDGIDWKDRTSWAPLGPGSKRGMNRLLGRPKESALTQTDFEHRLSCLIDELYPHIVEIWQDRNLIAMDIQNCLCEFDKYRRLTLKEGTVRAKYNGRD